MPTVVATATKASNFPTFLPPSSLLADKTTPLIDNDFTSEKPSFLHLEYSKKETAHVTNAMDHDNKASMKNKSSSTRSIHSNNRQQIIPSEFERWVQSHGGEQNFNTALINTNYTTKSRRKRSRLSYVSYSSSSSSSEEEEDDEKDFIPPQQNDKKCHPKEESQEQSIQFPSRSSSITTVHNYNTKTITLSGKPLIKVEGSIKKKNVDGTIPHRKDVQPQFDRQQKPCSTISPTSKSDAVIAKKNSWFTSLFNKQQNNSNTTKSASNSITTTSTKSTGTNNTTTTLPSTSTANKKSPTNTISNFFALKKQQQKEAQLMPSQQKKKNTIPRQYKLPTRYPLPIERVVYQISFMKISNPRRPLLHQVTISNMVFWYTSLIQQEVNKKTINASAAATRAATRNSPFYQHMMYASRSVTSISQ